MNSFTDILFVVQIFSVVSSKHIHVSQMLLAKLFDVGIAVGLLFDKRDVLDLEQVVEENPNRVENIGRSAAAMVSKLVESHPSTIISFFSPA